MTKDSNPVVNRQRREAALTLHAMGMKPENISQAVGATPETVRRWLRTVD